MQPIKIICLFFTLGAMLCLTACSPMRYKNPTMPETAVGSLKTDCTASVRIASIDGKLATGTLKGFYVKEFPDSLTILPGFHYVTPCYLTPEGVIYGDVLNFYAQAQKTYIIRHKVKWDKTIKFWVESDGVDITTE